MQKKALMYRRMLNLAVVAGSCFFISFITMEFMPNQYNKNGVGGCVVLTVFGGCLFLFLLSCFANKKALNMIEQHLAPNPSSVTALLTLSRTTSIFYVRKEAAKSLTALLPQLSESELRALSQEQRLGLYRLLLKADPALILAILKVIYKLQDCQALPFVQRLIARSNYVPTYASIKNLANATLLMLREQAAQGNSPHVLLRPAAPEIFPDTLLRSASGVEPSTPEAQTQLLRHDSAPAEPASAPVSASALLLTEQAASTEQVQALGTKLGTGNSQDDTL